MDPHQDLEKRVVERQKTYNWRKQPNTNRWPYKRSPTNKSRGMGNDRGSSQGSGNSRQFRLKEKVKPTPNFND